MSQKYRAHEGKVVFNSQQSPWKHLTSLETDETLFEAIAFLLEIQSAVGLFLLSLFFFHFQLRGNKSSLLIWTLF